MVKLWNVADITPLVVDISISVKVCELLTVSLIPKYEFIVYPVIAAPPVLVGAVHDIVADSLPGTAGCITGALGGATGVTEVGDEDNETKFAEFFATTVNV